MINVLIVRGGIDFGHSDIDLSTCCAEGEYTYLFVVAKHVKLSTVTGVCVWAGKGGMNVGRDEEG